MRVSEWIDMLLEFGLDDEVDIATLRLLAERRKGCI
jgi:hypothetical protein